MSHFPPPRSPQHFIDSPPFNRPRFPQENPRPPHFQPIFQDQGRPRGFGYVYGGTGGFPRNDTYRGGFRPVMPFPGINRGGRPQFSGRGRGGRPSHHQGFSHTSGHSSQNQGIQAYYKHSMVEDPWKELKENLNKNQQ